RPSAAWTCHSRKAPGSRSGRLRSEEHTSELQSLTNLVCRLLLEKKKRGHGGDRRRDCWAAPFGRGRVGVPGPRRRLDLPTLRAMRGPSSAPGAVVFFFKWSAPPEFPPFSPPPPFPD